MDETRQREIARKGGESVPAEKRSFSQNRALAAEAGRKGGTSRGARTTNDEKNGSNNRSGSSVRPQSGEESLSGYRAKNSPAHAADENPEEMDEIEQDKDDEDAEEEDGPSHYRN